MAPEPGSLRRESPSTPLADLPVGVVPIIWNNADLPDLAPVVPAGQVLDEIRRLGYQGAQTGVGFPSGAALARELAARGLRLAEVYAGIACTPDGPAPGALDAARARLDELHAAGGEVLVIALDRGADRDGWVSHAGEGAPGLTDAGWQALGETVTRIAGEARAMGHLAAFHNHAGTYVETPEELERLVSVTDPDLVGLCLDVGHAILGGGDPVALLERHGSRVVHVHLKDVDPQAMAALREGRIAGFPAALRSRIFAPLGSGLLDLPAVLRTLDRLGYGGWLMVEQDTAWEPPSEAAAIGRRVLAATLRWIVPAPRARDG